MFPRSKWMWPLQGGKVERETFFLGSFIVRGRRHNHIHYSSNKYEEREGRTASDWEKS